MQKYLTWMIKPIWKSYLIVCTFQKSVLLQKLTKMLMGNILYNWLLQGNGAITRVLAKFLQDISDRGVKRCIGKFFKTLG